MIFLIFLYFLYQEGINYLYSLKDFIGTTIEAFPIILARFKAIADFPVPHIPLMNIILWFSLIACKTSVTISSWDFPFEKTRGFNSFPS